MVKNQYWQPYSAKSALIRKFIPDIKYKRRLSDDLFLEASIKKHLMLFKNKELKREFATAQAIASYAPVDGVVYDIGANIGLYTLGFAQNRRRQVKSFEPSASALSYLRRNIQLNFLSNVEVFPVLLSDHTGTCNFTLDEVTTATSHVSSPGEPGIEVGCVDLDSYVKAMGIPLPDIIKMDVEGHDEAIFKGMEEILTLHHPMVYLEGGLRYEDNEIRSISYLEKIGYGIWDLSKGRRLKATTSEYAFLAVPE